MPPPTMPQSLLEITSNVIVQPEYPPTTIEVEDRHGSPMPVNVNLHEDADLRIDIIDQMRASEGLSRITWTEDLFHSKGAIPFGSMDDEDA
eukprot:5660672-Karenia_brevis.AAC.1